MANPPSTTTSNSLPPWKTDFLASCKSANALTFGTYTLKSGRVSPYFFNAGLFHRADLLTTLSTAFAETIASYASPSQNPETDSQNHSKPLEFDILFGPAYKGIPLAAATLSHLAALSPTHFSHISYAFNRKEAKTHGDGGSIVGAPLKGKRVVIIDDVITAGTAIKEAVEIIQKEGGTLVGVVVALDRMERMPSASDGGGGGSDGQETEGTGLSAIGEVRRRYGVPVLAVLTLEDIMQGLKAEGSEEDLKRMEQYRAQYRARD